MNREGRKCADCGRHDDGNSQTCKKGCSVKLFGVQIGVSSAAAVAVASSMRKSKSTGNLSEAAAEAEEPSGYLSDGIIDRYSGSHQRKRGKPWSEAEHRSFLEGLEKLGKGDWKGISNKFVPSRKSSQVASHAQKYFNRLNCKAAANKKRRRGSVFDIALPHYNHTATTSAASKNVGEFKHSTSSSVHVTSSTSEKPPLSPRKLSQIPGYLTYLQPRIYWVPMVSYPRPNGGFVGNTNGRFATVMPQPYEYDDTFPQDLYFPTPPNSTTINDELVDLNIRNLTLNY